MIYLETFEFPSENDEFFYFMKNEDIKRNTYYPFQILAPKELTELTLAPLTVLYGGNGSGKTTVLNIIAEKLYLARDTLYNRSDVFEDYTSMCSYSTVRPIPRTSRVITSDDVFDYMLHLRGMNQEIDDRRREMEARFASARGRSFQLHSLEDAEELRLHNAARRMSSSQYIQRNADKNMREHSNGESAFSYFVSRIDKAGLYLLDEPENSLSPERQQELARFLADSARFYDCQFLIATHSPFLLAAEGARIYDMDAQPPCTKRWTELPNVRAYYDFFRAHGGEFEGADSAD